jgi:hypothetical protein
MDQELEQPVQKKLRQDCLDDCIVPSTDTWELCSILH